MSINAEVLRRIAALKLPTEALSEVLSIIADMQAEGDARKAKDRDRKRKSRGQSADSPLADTGQSAENPEAVRGNSDGKAGAYKETASAPVCSNGSSLRSEPELFKPLPSEGPLPAKRNNLDDPAAADGQAGLGKKRAPVDILAECVSRRTAADIVEHRKKLRKPLTERAAEENAKALVECGDPEAGAAMWIALGWQGFRVDWYRNELARSNARAGPQKAAKRNPFLADYERELSEQGHAADWESHDAPPADPGGDDGKTIDLLDGEYRSIG